MASEPWAFDSSGDEGPTFDGALAFQLPASQQQQGPLWPTPAGNVSDHSAEGAPWQPTADDFERQPGWTWQATGSELGQAQYLGQHDGPSIPYSAAAATAYAGGSMGAQPGWNHDGADALTWQHSADWGPNGAEPLTFELVRFGRPFTVNQGSAESRTLATDQWDPTGKRINPSDSPSAPHELYGSDHYTRPRMIPFEPGGLMTWAWAEGQQFPSSNPGYWGVSANEPDLSARPQGAVMAQQPSNPYVAPSVPGPAQAAGPDYDLGF